MSHDPEEQEPTRDAELAALLRDRERAAGEADPDWGALRARIRAAAEPVAARHRPAARRPTTIRRFAWTAGPMLAAATIAAILLLGHGQRPAPVTGPATTASSTSPSVPTSPSTTPAPTSAAPGAAALAASTGYASAEDALLANVSDTEFSRRVTGDDDPAALLRIAVAAQ
jgi:hypothetical protein